MSSLVVLRFAMRFPQFHDVDHVVSHAFNLLVPGLAEMAVEQVSEGGRPPDLRRSRILSITCRSNLTPAVRFLSCMGMLAKPDGGDGLVAWCCLAFHELFSLMDLYIVVGLVQPHHQMKPVSSNHRWWNTPHGLRPHPWRARPCRRTPRRGVSLRPCLPPPGKSPRCPGVCRIL